MNPRLYLEEYFALSESTDSERLYDLIKILKRRLKTGEFSEIEEVLRHVVQPDIDYTSLISLARIANKIPQKHFGQSVLRIAILSSTTTNQLRILLELFLITNGIPFEIYEAGYGLFRNEILESDSKLYSFKPSIVFLATDTRDVLLHQSVDDSADTVLQIVRYEIENWRNLWTIVHDRLDCGIIQNNFVLPAWRPLGNLDHIHPSGDSYYYSELNRQLIIQAPEYVIIHDLDALASAFGRWRWSDQRYYHEAKLPCTPEALPVYAHSVASLISAFRGLPRKCLVLDLDNTIWGGTIGDDGIGGIRLGQGDAVGEAFVAFQRYVKALKNRGVILAVCSKNNEAIARQVFETHPEMVLTLEDISCFVANWEDKHLNIQAIGDTLNIGLDSIVFFDDNPVERSIVRQNLPAVAVPEVPDDPTGYIQLLDSRRYFQPLTIQAEDFRKTEYYRANALRKQAGKVVTSVSEYLASLEMIGRIQVINNMTIQRSVQLINKSNQFNLTTRRYGIQEIRDRMDSDDWLTLSVSLKDRFGDNGLISVLLAKKTHDMLHIDTWLMSCRVLKRGVEKYLLNRVVREAEAQGITRIRGEYLPTLKNELVRWHYKDLGFSLVDEKDSGETLWELDTTSWSPLENHIREEGIDNND